MLKKQRNQIKKNLLGFSKQILSPGATTQIKSVGTKAKHKVFGKPQPVYKYKKVVKGWKTVNVKKNGKWIQKKKPILKRVKVKIKYKPTPKRTGRSFVGY